MSQLLTVVATHEIRADMVETKGLDEAEDARHADFKYNDIPLLGQVPPTLTQSCSLLSSQLGLPQ